MRAERSSCAISVADGFTNMGNSLASMLPGV
jgi:hypothetical protein